MIVTKAAKVGRKAARYGVKAVKPRKAKTSHATTSRSAARGRKA